VAVSVTQALEQRLDPTSAQPFVVRSNEDPEARALYLRARASLQLGRRHDALAALQPSRGELWADTLALVACDDHAGALALLRARRREMIDMPFAIASLFASAGDTAESLAWLQRAYALRQIDLVSLAVDPAFEPARTDPRFQALVAKVGL
jgi:hypothetical protein